MTNSYRAVLSPCIGICRIDDEGLCAGCLRTGAEIAQWPMMHDRARLRLMDEVLPRRAAERHAGTDMPRGFAVMGEAAALAQWLRRAVHPLHCVPSGRGWNHRELEGLLPARALRPAAVLVGVVAHPSAPTVLLTRRHDDLRLHAGQVSLPGGGIDPADASPAAAALREAFEEVGLQAAHVLPLGYLDPLLTITGFRIVPLLGLIVPDFVAEPDPVEVAEAFEVPLDVLLDPGQIEEKPVQVGGKSRRVLQYRFEKQRIWGATASILFNLRERLANTTPGGT